MARNKRIQKTIEVRKQTAANRAKQEPEAPQSEPLRVENLPEDRVLDTETTPPSAQKDTQRASAEPDAESIEMCIRDRQRGMAYEIKVRRTV